MGKKTVNSNEDAVQVMLDGGIIEYGDRYYRYQEDIKKLQYSDYGSGNWKDSNYSVEEFKTNSGVKWNVVG